MDREREYREKIIRPEEAFSMIRDGDCISVGGNLCEPQVFLAALGDHAEKMNGVEIVTGKQQTYSYQTKPGLRGRLDTIGHFFDAGQREGFRLGNVTHVPTNLHDYMKVVQESRRTNVFVAQVTSMDENGDFTLSGSNMWEGENLDHAETIILEVNPHIPRFRGCIRIPLHDVTALYEVDTSPVTIPRSVPSETDKAIAGYVAEHIHDGDCIQMGIGGMPDTVAGFLFDKHDLGLHTEMFTSACADLIEAGVITGARKNLDTGRHVGTFTLGDERAYRIYETNPDVLFRPASYTNDPMVIARIDNMVSVNTALEIDLTGQICSESIGPLQWSGTAGAWDFAYGASQSRGGRGIIALSSTAKKGTISRIRATLTPGAVVTIPRTIADIVVTEYGVAYLRGRTVRQRAQALIAVAHPDFREPLRSEAHRLGYL